MKEITIQYYAVLRERRGLSKEKIRTKAVTAKDLYWDLDKKYHFAMAQDILRVAVNNEFADWDTKIKNGDEILFIPPVAGG